MMETLSHEEILARITREMDALEADLIADTQRIIAFQTVSGGTPEQEAKYRTEIPACLEWLRGKAEAHGLQFRHWDNKVAEIQWTAEAPDTGFPLKSVGIASHIDVVTPVGTWKFGPFNAQIEDGILYGRGIQDDKGPLIQSLYGIIAARRAGVRLPVDVRIIIGTSEETGDWSDIAHYIAVAGAPDATYTPDADFPIIIGEKGMLNLVFRAKWPAVEPDPETGLYFVSLKGGERTNIIPSVAEAVLRFPVESKHAVMKELVRETTRFTVENDHANVTLVPNHEQDSEAAGYYESLVSFLGKAAHSSQPWSGHNAIMDALKFFADVETLPATVRTFIQFLALIGANSDGANLQIDGTHDFVGPTTAALTLLTITKEGGEANLNVRPTMGTTCAEVRAKAIAAASAFEEATGLVIEVANDPLGVEAIYMDPTAPGTAEFLASLQAAYQVVTGEEPKLQAIGGTTYAKAFPNCCAFGPVKLGVDQELAHQANECLAVASIRRNALIYGMSVALLGRA